MGGSISVTLIEENGTMHKMQRWTNPIPRFMSNMKFFNKDKEHIENYLNGWLPLKEDWEKNGPNGPFKHPGTRDFFPSIGLSPDEYGILVIDLQKNKIYSIQNYTDFSQIERFNRELDEDDDWIEKNDRYKEFEDAGRILESRDSSDEMFTRSKIDTSPFEIVWFDKTSENMKICMETLDAEYGLNEEEKKRWNENIDWLIEYEEKVRERKEEENKEFWKRKKSVKKQILTYPKTFVLEGPSSIRKRDFINEIAEEVNMNMLYYSFKEKENTFQSLLSPIEENSIVFFDDILFLDEGEETDILREFVKNTPSNCIVVLSKRASYENPILKEIMN